MALTFEHSCEDLIGAVKAAACANMRAVQQGLRRLSRTTDAPLARSAMTMTTERIVAIGTSTGCTTALQTLLASFPQDTPGLLIVKHMPERYTASFAARRLFSRCIAGAPCGGNTRETRLCLR